jgi:hypothetical protein
MPLAATKLPALEAKQKPYKVADGEGLYLLVRPDGSRYWRLKYRFAGKEKLLALGVYPDVSLKEARDKRADAKKLLRDGKDPGQVRRQEKQRAREAAENSFEAVAEEWIGKQAHRWDERHSGRVRASLKANLYDDLGRRPLAVR